MSLAFYFAPMSTASITEAVLAELGIQCSRIRLDIRAGDTRTPEFLAINPNGRVPVIVHDGTAIWESAAITMYLGEVFGVGLDRYPALGPRRGEAMRWIVWSNVSLAEAAGRLAASVPAGSDGAVEPGSRDWVAPELRSVGTAATARADLAGFLAILDRALVEQPYLLGTYSLVDTHLHALVGWITTMDVDLTSLTHLREWLQRCDARPALATLTA